MTIFAIPSWSGLAIDGDKAAEFLQGQTTCDINDITPTSSRFTAFCNHQGRVLFSGRLLYSDKGFTLLLPTSLLELAQAHLEKYGIFSQIQVRQLSQPLLAQLGNGPIDEITPEGTLQHSTDCQLLLNTTENATADDMHWQWLNIQAGIALLTPETSGKFTPHMLNYPALNAVSFTKGCYVGQEIIARTQHLGQAKRGLKQVTLKTLHAPGDNCEYGQVIDCQPNPDNPAQFDALVVG